MQFCGCYNTVNSATSVTVTQQAHHCSPDRWHWYWLLILTQLCYLISSSLHILIVTVDFN